MLLSVKERKKKQRKERGSIQQELFSITAGRGSTSKYECNSLNRGSVRIENCIKFDFLNSNIFFWNFTAQNQKGFVYTLFFFF